MTQIVVLALVLAGATPAGEQSWCVFTKDAQAGVNRICYYLCAGGAAAITVTAARVCPAGIDNPVDKSDVGQAGPYNFVSPGAEAGKAMSGSLAASALVACQEQVEQQREQLERQRAELAELAQARKELETRQAQSTSWVLWARPQSTQGGDWLGPWEPEGGYSSEEACKAAADWRKAAGIELLSKIPTLHTFNVWTCFPPSFSPNK